MIFITNAEQPFIFKEGTDEPTILLNRVAALDRINFLVRQAFPDFDIRLKADDFLKCMALELWKRFYQEAPRDKKIDEEFCQHVAQVCCDMEGP